MFDAIYVRDMQRLGFSPSATAGYTSGWWPSYTGLVAAFPRSRHVSIAINVLHAADCLDVEPGDASPSQVPGWIRWMRSLHRKLICVYSSVSEWGGITVPARVKKWCAWYRFRPGLLIGCDAVQWTDRAHGLNLDESTVRLDFFGPLPHPHPKPRPHPKPAKPAPCFGPRYHHQAACNPVRRRVAAESRQIVQIRRTLTARGCWQHPHRHGCHALRAQGDRLHQQINLNIRARA